MIVARTRFFRALNLHHTHVCYKRNQKDIIDKNLGFKRRFSTPTSSKESSGSLGFGVLFIAGLSAMGLWYYKFGASSKSKSIPLPSSSFGANKDLVFSENPHHLKDEEIKARLTEFNKQLKLIEQKKPKKNTKPKEH